MDTILKKYKVRDANSIQSMTMLDEKNDDGGHYKWEDFHNDPFVKDLKQLLVDYFTPIAKAKGLTLYEAAKATPERLVLITSVLIRCIRCNYTIIHIRTILGIGRYTSTCMDCHCQLLA